MSLIEKVKSDPSVSRWLKAQLDVLLDRDPVDALNDLELLQQLMEIRLLELQNNG